MPPSEEFSAHLDSFNRLWTLPVPQLRRRPRMNCPGSSRQGNSRLPHPLRLPAVATKRVRLRRNTTHRFMGPRCKYLLCSSDATSVTNTGVCRSPTEWDIGQVFPIPEAPATSAPVLALGKRRREEPRRRDPDRRSSGAAPETRQGLAGRRDPEDRAVRG